MLRDSEVMMAHARRAVEHRHRQDDAERAIRNAGAVLVSAMIAEEAELKKSMAYMDLDFYGRMRYVAENSEYVHSRDGNEAIQIVWMSNRQILIHRLIGRELREEFNSHYLGVWVQNSQPWERERVRHIMRAKLNQRAWLRELKRTQGALDFGSEFQPGVLKIKGPQG
jgi:hypothetical protein